MRQVLVWIWIGAAACSAASADVLVFKTGGRLNGTLTRMEAGKLFFASEELGEVNVPLSEVANLTTEAQGRFVFKDGTVVFGKVMGIEAGRLILSPTDLMPGQTYDLGELAAINPPPTVPPTWKGSITAAYATAHGNTYSESGSISFDATRRTEKDRTSAFSRYIVARAENKSTSEKRTTEESLTIGGKYDYFFSKKLYGFLDGRFKKDHVANLDRRIIAGLGLGYQWIETAALNVSTDAGASILCEKYTSRGKVTQTDDLSARLGYHLDWTIRQGINVIHNLTYYPSVTGSLSDYFLTTDAEVRVALTKSMFGSAKAILDFDSTPPEGVGSTDTKYIVGLGWTF